MASSRLSSKGQVTIPLEVRTRLGLQPGDRVEFVNEGGKTVILPERKRSIRFGNTLEPPRDFRPVKRSIAGFASCARMTVCPNENSDRYECFSAVWGREAAAEKISLWLDDAASQGAW